MSINIFQFAPKYLANWQAQEKAVFMSAIELILKEGTKDEQGRLLKRVEGKSTRGRTEK